VSAPALATADTPAKAPKPSVPKPIAPRFKQVRDRIDALFGHRNETPPAPDLRTNPFRVPGAPVPAASVASREEGAPAPTAPAAVEDLSLLQESAATLRVSGVFEIGGRSHLVINARPYKEGDVVQTQVKGEAVYLRVREISKRSVTLELNEAELTLKF
jgi:hypothetical protein